MCTYRVYIRAGDKRLRQHLEFLVSNLGYEHETGREAALDFVTVLINKFPEQLVAQWSETVGGWTTIIL